MPHYRRSRLEGGTFFFTVVSHRRQPILCRSNVRAALRSAIESVRAEFPFQIRAWVLLPDHLHCVWTLPEGNTDFSGRWSRIKRLVTRDCVGSYPTQTSSSRTRRREGGIWQRRFWEHTIRDEEDLRRCMDYIHWNPVKHGHVQRVADWPHSTFHRLV